LENEQVTKPAAAGTNKDLRRVFAALFAVLNTLGVVIRKPSADTPESENLRYLRARVAGSLHRLANRYDRLSRVPEVLAYMGAAESAPACTYAVVEDAQGWLERTVIPPSEAKAYAEMTALADTDFDDVFAEHLVIGGLPWPETEVGKEVVSARQELQDAWHALIAYVPEAPQRANLKEVRESTAPSRTPEEALVDKLVEMAEHHNGLAKRCCAIACDTKTEAPELAALVERAQAYAESARLVIALVGALQRVRKLESCDLQQKATSK
jgi:hypothetical protein